MGAAEQEQAVVDAEVGGRDKRGVCILLQVSLQRLGGPPGGEALLRGGPAGVPRAALLPVDGAVGALAGHVQREGEERQALRQMQTQCDEDYSIWNEHAPEIYRVTSVETLYG